MGMYNYVDIFYAIKINKPENKGLKKEQKIYFYHDLFPNPDTKLKTFGDYIAIKGTSFSIKDEYSWYGGGGEQDKGKRNFKNVVKYVLDEDVEKLKNLIESAEYTKYAETEEILYRTDPMSEWIKLEGSFKWYIRICCSSTYGPPPTYWESSESHYELINVEDGFKDAMCQKEVEKSKKLEEIKNFESELKTKYGITDTSVDNLKKIHRDIEKLLILISELSDFRNDN